MIPGVSGVVFLEAAVLAVELLGGVSALGLSWAVNHRVILWFNKFFFPGTAILLLGKEQETSLTAALGIVMESVVPFPGDSNDGEAIWDGTEHTCLLTSDTPILLLLKVS